MAFSAGAITGTIKLNTGPFMDSLGSVRSSLSRFASMTARIGGAISAALGGVGAGAAIKLAADFEQTNVAFSTLLGSAAKAKAMLGDLQQFAMSTPFEFTGLTQSAKLFLAMGFDAKKLIPTLKAVGDISAGLNLGDSGLQHIIMILGQMKSTGTIHAQDMLQLTQMGIPAWNLMADTIGKSVAETKQLGMNGKLSADQFIQAFIAMKGPLAKFNGLMGEESKTLGGLFSNLKDTITNTLRDVGQALVTKLNLKEAVANWTSGIAAMKDKLVDFAAQLAVDVKAIAAFAKSNAGLIIDLGELAAAAIAASKAMAIAKSAYIACTFAAKLLAKATAAATVATKVFLATGVGILITELAVMATAFVNSKIKGESYGQALLDMAKNFGLASDRADKFADANARIAASGKKAADAMKALAVAVESNNLPLKIGAEKTAIAAVKAQIAAQKKANALTPGYRPSGVLFGGDIIGGTPPIIAKYKQTLAGLQAQLKQDILAKNAAAWNAWTESLRNDFSKVKSTALAAFDAIRQGLEKITDARNDLMTKIALFGASAAQRQKFDILEQAKEMIAAAKKFHILTPKLRSWINAKADAQIADIGKDTTQPPQPPKMTPLLLYGSAEQQRLAYMRSRGMMGQVGGTPQQEQKKQTKEQEKSNDLLERINNSLQKQNAGQSGGGVINWSALFG